jgi:multiple sugar transport system substrate-binding protein
MFANRKSRRVATLLGAAGMVALIAASIGVGSVGAQDPTTVTLVDPWAGAPGLNAAQEAQIARFNESHPDIQVERSGIVFGDFVSQLVKGATAGELPDVALIDNPDFNHFAALGVLHDLTAQIDAWGQKDLYFPEHWSSTTFGGVEYGIPVFSNDLQLWVNTDMLAEAGVEIPTTWAELEDAAAKLTTPDHFGLVVAGIHNEEGTFQWLPFLWSAGSDLATINDEGGQAALQLWTDLVNDGSMSQGILNWDQGAAKDEFANGRAAMMIAGPWFVPTMTDDFPDIHWQVAAIPKDEGFSSILGGENYGVTLDSPNADAAWEFIRWTQEPDNYKQFLKDTGMFPSRSDIAEDPYWADDPVRKVFLEGVKVAKARAYGENYAEMSNAIQDAIQAAVSGQSSVKDALDAANETIQPLLPPQ